MDRVCVLAEAERFLANATRWEVEFKGAVRTTLWHGMISRACNQLECLIHISISLFANLLSRPIEASGAQPTLGELLTYVEEHNAEAARAVRHRLPELQIGARLLRKSDLKVFRAIIRIRNDVAHGRVDYMRDTESFPELLGAGRSLCRCPLVTVAATLEGALPQEVDRIVAAASRGTSS